MDPLLAHPLHTMNNTAQTTQQLSNHDTDRLSFSSNSQDTSQSQQPRKRVRTGCLNCRRKHKKCDEHKPICHGCVSKNEVCEWPMPKLKKASRRNSLHQTYTPMTPALPPARHLPQPYNLLPGTTTSPFGINYTTNTSELPPPNGSASQFPPYSGAIRPTAIPTTTTAISAIPSTQNNPINNGNANMHARRPSNDLFSYSLGSFNAPKQQQIPTNVSDISSNSARDTGDGHYSPTRNYQLSSALPLGRSESVEAPKRSGVTSIELSELEALANKFAIHLGGTGSISTTPTSTAPLIMRDDEILLYLEEFVSNIAPTMDIDEKPLFVEEIPLLMKNNSALMYAVYAMASLTINCYTSPLTLFKSSLNHLFDQTTNPDSILTYDSTILFLTLFLYHHNLHHQIVSHLTSTIPTIQFHYTLLRLTTSQILIPEHTHSTTSPHTLLPLLSIHQSDFLTAFNKAQSLSTTNHPSLDFNKTPFPTILIPSPRLMHTHLLLDTAMVFLLSHKPMDVRVRSHPVAHYAKKICGLIETNKKRLPWYAEWCLYNAGKIFTHESEHELVLELMKRCKFGDGWEKKITDYWDGTGDV